MKILFKALAQMAGPLAIFPGAFLAIGAIIAMFTRPFGFSWGLATGVIIIEGLLIWVGVWASKADRVGEQGSADDMSEKGRIYDKTGRVTGYFDKE